MSEKKRYQAAVYLRLSREDGCSISKKNETGKSLSIRVQKDLICAYINKRDDIEIYGIYTDDGYPGTNFQRPDFQRMMKDIQTGCVNCVIVKDLSRLGRDYIEVGRLIQKTFPAFGVRFIALTDRFDSLTANDCETSMIVPVKNFVNDSYARDISNKVRSHLKIKREEGAFVGAFAVYGYQKCADNKNLLVPDLYAAHVVQKIFAWKIEGYSNLAIAEHLDALGILSPMEYKKIHGEHFQTGFVTGVNPKWSAVAVKRILVNETYTGTLVQGKEEKVNYKIKKSVKKPEETWIKVPKAHEAIITEETFQLVQDLLNIDMHAGCGEKRAHMYAGLLFCGDCKKPMIRRKTYQSGKEVVSFICATKNKEGTCSRHSIFEDDLKQLLLTAIRQQIALFGNQSEVCRKLAQVKSDTAWADIFEGERKRLCHALKKYVNMRSYLQQDFEKGIITQTEFLDFGEIYQKRCRRLWQMIQRQEETKKKLIQSEKTANLNLECLKKQMQVTKLDRIALISFVKRIYVYEGKRIFIEFRHRELFSEFLGETETFL